MRESRPALIKSLRLSPSCLFTTDWLKRARGHLPGKPKRRRAPNRRQNSTANVKICIFLGPCGYGEMGWDARSRGKIEPTSTFAFRIPSICLMEHVASFLEYRSFESSRLSTLTLHQPFKALFCKSIMDHCSASTATEPIVKVLSKGS